MYVVKRPFRNFGKTLVAGTLIEDTSSIKRFKTRLAEGKIIEVTEENYKNNVAYFKGKYGIDISHVQSEKPVKHEEKSEQKPVVAKAVASVIPNK